MMNKKIAKNIDEYIQGAPAAVRPTMLELRSVIKKAAPQAEEVISYGMPAFKLKKVLVYFALCKTHIGFYPTPSGVRAFKKELSPYVCSKGAVQFPLAGRLPWSLIGKIVKFRVAENLKK
jgi:uncharacterized protein YdhG (YjbR/CyaY superfamily)